MRAALNQFSQELGDTFQVLCCGARPYGTQTPWAPVSQPAQRVQPKPPDVRQSLSRKQVSPHFWPTGRGAGVGGRGVDPPIVQSCFLSNLPPLPVHLKPTIGWRSLSLSSFTVMQRSFDSSVRLFSLEASNGG